MKELFERIRANIYFQLLGWILSIICGALTLITYFHTPCGEITFDVTNQTELVPSSIPSSNKVAIYYNNEDVYTRNISVRQYSISITNTGDIDILPTFYDQNDPLCIEFKNIIAIDSIQIKSPHHTRFQNTIRPSINNTTILFNNTLFEKKGTFTAIFNVAYNKDSTPDMSLTGAIANTKLKLRNSHLNPEPPNTISRIFSDSIYINMLRSIIFFFITPIGLFAILIPIILAISAIDPALTFYRSSHFKKCLGVSTLNIEEQPQLKFLYKKYRHGGKTKIEDIITYITNEEDILHDAAELTMTEKIETYQNILREHIKKKYNINEIIIGEHKISELETPTIDNFIAENRYYTELKKLGVIRGALNSEIDSNFIELARKTLRCL